MSETQSESDEPLGLQIRRRHLIFGWWALAGFAVLGIALEALHGFKAPWFLDPGYETRRLLWRLAHAHGGLLSLVQLGFAATVPSAWPSHRRGLRLTSTLLILAGLLLPLGFFLGGVTLYGGDPGPGILLAPIGAACFAVAAVRIAWEVTFGRGD